MKEILTSGPRRVIATQETNPSNNNNNIPESVLDLGRRLVSDELGPEDSLRQVWRMSLAGELTPSQRQEGLKYLQSLFPPGVLTELSRPINPEGQTHLAQIAAEEVRAAKEAAKARETMVRRITPKKPSKGMRKHIRNEKAEARRARR